MSENFTGTTVENEVKDTIKHMNETLDKILGVLQKPENKLARILKLLVLEYLVSWVLLI
jgi:ribosomal protein L10